MIDPLAAALDGALHHRATALPLAALAGIATSFGPCIAPRYLAVVALASERRSPAPVLAFFAGLVTAFVALGSGAALLAAVVAHAAVVNAIAAAALIAGGLATILRDPSCTEHAGHSGGVRTSGAFALGAASAFVVSPCCTPAVLAFAALGASEREPLVAAATLAAFACGHAAPLLFSGVLGGAGAAALRRFTATGAPATVAGTLAIALGCYEWMLV